MRVLSADGCGSPKKRLVLSTYRRAKFHLWIESSDTAAIPGHRVVLALWEASARPSKVNTRLSRRRPDSVFVNPCAYEREFNKLFRIPAKRPKVVGSIEDVEDSDHEFRRHVRAGSTCGRKVAKSAETHFLTFIWYAANKTCMRDVASRFDMSESTVYRVLQRVAQFLMTLGPSVIKFPADLENLTSSFEKNRNCFLDFHICSDLEPPRSEAAKFPRVAA
ncbi:hypothetical protein MRX96_027419 [Rhipicephalus microplus]